MNKLALYVFFVFLQSSLFMFGHWSRLEKIEDIAGNKIGALGGLTGNSQGGDVPGVCYGTSGQSTEIYGPFQIFPRCHSEFYLLNQIQQSMPTLVGLILYIRNESYPPCKLVKGAVNPRNGKKELNPGTPCHQYLTNFAQRNHCRIIVLWPNGEFIYQ